jgi:isopentenyl-diphosphate delta-isomerase
MTDEKDMLTLVDSEDNPIGVATREECHTGKGKMHRALSIFVFNSKGEILLQKRSKEKQLWPSFWTNTCCTHSKNGESVEEVAHRRLEEEMGFDCGLKEIFSFEYRAKYENVGSENEFDHVLFGKYDGHVFANPKEVEEWKWVDVKKLRDDLEKNPQDYTPWFKIALKKLDKVERWMK